MTTIALDYDGTYTADPKLWDNFLTLSKQRGHKVYVVTMRYDNQNEGNEVRESLQDKVEGIFFTGRRAKRTFLYNEGIHINIWIDDTPDFIVQDANG